MKISNRLELKVEKHFDLGDVITLFSKSDKNGSAAFLLEGSELNNNNNKRYTLDTGVGLRLTKKTALKLARQLLKSIGRTK